MSDAVWKYLVWVALCAFLIVGLAHATAEADDRFTPKRISGLIGWWDAAKGITITGAGVSQWNDQSASGFNLTQGTDANRPTYNTSSTLIPGRPSLSFNGTSHRINNNSVAADFTGTDEPISVFAVASTTSLAATQNIWSLGRSTSATPFLRLEILTSGDFRFNRRDDASSGVVTTASGVSINTPYVVSAVFTGTTGDLVHSGSTGNLAAAMDVGAATLNVFGFGCRFNNSTSEFLVGDIWEVIVYNKALSLRERKMIERYLGRKYRRPVQLIK